MDYVEQARYLDEYRIWVRMGSGSTGIVDFAETVRTVPAAAPMQDLSEFKQFYLDAWPSLAWPCGYDIAPEVLAARVVPDAEVAAASPGQ
jgi:hypothetical protein